MQLDSPAPPPAPAAAPAPAALAPPTADPTAPAPPAAAAAAPAQATASAAHAAGSGSAAGAGGGAAELALLQKAQQKLIAAGVLPPGRYPQLALCLPNAKQLKQLPPGVAYTSAAALALAGVARKQQQQQQGQGQTLLAADAIAEHLAALFNAEAAAAGSPFRAAAARGHLNFSVNGAAGAAAAAGTQPAQPAGNGVPAASASTATPTPSSRQGNNAQQPPGPRSQASRAPDAGRQAGGGAAREGGAGAGARSDRPRELEVRMAPSEFDAEEFELYKRYQVRAAGQTGSAAGHQPPAGGWGSAWVGGCPPPPPPRGGNPLANSLSHSRTPRQLSSP
jgi:hypothetical protein